MASGRGTHEVAPGVRISGVDANLDSSSPSFAFGSAPPTTTNRLSGNLIMDAYHRGYAKPGSAEYDRVAGSYSPLVICELPPAIISLPLVVAMLRLQKLSTGSRGDWT